MKYFIDSKRPIEDVIDIERELPTRSEVARLINKRYRTDAMYFYADRVGMVFIVDLDDSEQLSEIVLLVRRAGLIPYCYPLIASQEMDRILVDLADIS
jgi:hypothetical protein